MYLVGIRDIPSNSMALCIDLLILSLHLLLVHSFTLLPFRGLIQAFRHGGGRQGKLVLEGSLDSLGLACRLDQRILVAWTRLR